LVALHLRSFSERSKAGALTYTSNVIARVPLQAILSPDEFVPIRDQFDSLISQLESRNDVTPILGVQYQTLRRLLSDRKTGWIELVFIPSRGVLSQPIPGKSGATAAAILMVSVAAFPVATQATDLLTQPEVSSQ